MSQEECAEYARAYDEISALGEECSQVSEEECTSLLREFHNEYVGSAAAPQVASEAGEGANLLEGVGLIPRDWIGKLELVLPGLLEAELDTGVGVAMINDTGDQLETVSLVAGGLTGSTILPVTDPIVSNGGLVSIRATATLRSGDLEIDPSGFLGGPAITEGTVPLPGELRLCIYVPGCEGGLFMDLTRSLGNGVQGIGVGGLLTVGGLGQIRLSVVGAPWTVNTTSIGVETVNGAATTIFSGGFIHGPVSFTSTGALTWNGVGGVLQMVTPIRVTSLPGVGSQNVIGGFARVTLQFLPEPSSLVLLTTSSAVLFLIGRARRRRRQTR